MSRSACNGREGPRGGSLPGREPKKKPKAAVDVSLAPETAPSNLRLVVSGEKEEAGLFLEFKELARAWLTKKLGLGYEGDELQKRVAQHMSQLTKEHFQQWRSGEGGWNF